MFKLTNLLLSLTIGALFTLLLFALSEYGIATRLVGMFLSPSLLLAMLANSGSHNLHSNYLVGGGDALLYAGIVFFLIKLLDGRLRHRNNG
jgi:hypothetical protein